MLFRIGGLALVVLVHGGCGTEATEPGPADAAAPRDAAREHDSGTTTAPPDAGAPDDGGPPIDVGGGVAAVPMFVAQGMYGRSTISCDDGRTWVANRSFEL